LIKGEKFLYGFIKTEKIGGKTQIEKRDLVGKSQEYKMRIPKEKIVEIYKTEYLNGDSAARLDEKHKVGGGYFSRWFKKLNLKTRGNEINSRKYSFNKNYFDNIDNQDTAYWLGFIYADGYIVSRQKHNNRALGISLAEKDKSHLEKFRKCIDGNTPIGTYRSSGYSNTKYCRLLLKDEDMIEKLISHGVLEHKTNILQPPNVDEHLVPHFIRGYFDGDGSVWKQNNDKGKNIQYSVGFTGTEELLSFVQNHLLAHNVIQRLYPLRKRKPHHTVVNFKFGGNHNSLRFLDYIYSGSNIRLDRKFEIYLDLKRLVEIRLSGSLHTKGGEK